MKICRRKSVLLNSAFLGSAVFGLVGFATQAGAQNLDAQNLEAASLSQPVSAEPIADEKLRMRVRDALHSDPYFYDEHVTVSVENGAVVLRGFVSSDWDLRNAIRIARSAAGGRRVIDNLSIEQGGNR